MRHNGDRWLGGWFVSWLGPTNYSSNRLSNHPTNKLILRVFLISAVCSLHCLQAAHAARTMLTINDLTWQGMFQFPAGGLADPGGPGTTAYSSGALAVRYVNGRRRFLVPNFTIGDPATGQLWGDLVEYEEPAGNRYTGPDPGPAPGVVETRRWKNWTLFPVTPNWQEPTTGTRIGGLYWDEMHGVLWYQLYGYYSGKNIPLLGAVRLLDTVTTGNYCAVGAMYGPWWYGSNNPADPNLYWKSVNYWMVPVPR